MMQLARLSVVAVAVLLASANAGKHLAAKTIVDTALSTGKHTVLAAALTKANLITTLNGTGPFTVFAPTDAAFTAAMTMLKATKEQLLANPLLKDILTYHVVSGTVKSTSLTNGMKAKTLNGANLSVSITGTTVKVNTATVTTADVMCSNGVIHIIDMVLVPPAVMTAVAAAAKAAAAPAAATKNIVETAVAAGSFTVLAEALTKADLVTTLSGKGPFTVFAPTDAAFTAALTALKVTKAQLLALPNLKAILTYHVVGGTVKSTGLSNGMKAATVNGAKVTVTIAGKTVKVNDATVSTADVMCSNGVIHIIDKVLMPPTAAATTAAPAPAAAATTVAASSGVDASKANPAKVFWALVVSATISTFVLA